MAPLIGLYSPAAQSGKSTLANGLGKFGYQRVAFAAPLKNMLRSLLRDAGADDALIERMVDGDLKEVPTPYLQGRTPRYAMQTLGTEWGRKLIGDGLWVSTAISKANKLRDTGVPVVIDDVRFENEADAVTVTEGVMVKVVRPGAADCTGHVSEGALEHWPFDLVVNNTHPNAKAFQEDMVPRVSRHAVAKRT